MTNHSEKSFKEALNKERHRQQHEKGARRRKLQAVTKKLKPNRRGKRVRRKDWLPDDLEDWDDFDYEVEERMRPLGESERRRALEAAVFNSKPDRADRVEPAPPPAGERGRVIQVSQGLSRVDLGGRSLLCSLRGSLSAEETGFTNVVAVGDEVIVSPDGAESGVIEAVLPRRSTLARPDVFYSHLQQVIAANVDQILIVSSWQEPPLWLELIDRYLIAAHRNRLPVLICLNKMDLVQDEAECEATLQPYRFLDYPILLTSAITGRGIDGLRGWLQGRTTVLAGLSGVGKSSLLTAVQPNLKLRVGEVSQSSRHGQHTTTQASLIQLNVGSAVVDTPGIREFGLSGLLASELDQFFPDIAAPAAACRFHNCSHLDEPDCAVQAAVASEAIAASRYHSYRQIYQELPA